MQYRTLGRTGLRVSEVGFGAWAIGGPARRGELEIGWGEVDEAQSLRAIEAAYDAGVTLFDTADVYGAGRSERRRDGPARPVGRHATRRVARGAPPGAIPPPTRRSAARPGGLPGGLLDGGRRAYPADRSPGRLRPRGARSVRAADSLRRESMPCPRRG